MQVQKKIIHMQTTALKGSPKLQETLDTNSIPLTYKIKNYIQFQIHQIEQ